jgi:glycosyltransferase involved in cell wall biosynthesis
VTTARRTAVHVVRSDSFAGVERYICDTVTELDRRGWGVTVVGGDPAQMRSLLPASVAVCPAVTTLGAARALWSLGGVDIVHTHMTAAEAAAATLPPQRYGRWVTTRHFASTRGASLLGRAASPLVRSRVDQQVSISQYVADAIGEPSVVIHNGVPRSIQPVSDRHRTVVMMQRLQPEKDTSTGIHAWALSKLAADGWRLQIFGRGDERDQLETLASSLGVAESVSFEGFQPEPRRLLSTAGMVLATAPTEPFGLSVVEAMAEGAPIVAADGGAHRETLGNTAVLFAPGDAAEAGRALRSVALDSAARHSLGSQLRARYEERFTVEGHVDQLEAVYGR